MKDSLRKLHSPVFFKNNPDSVSTQKTLSLNPTQNFTPLDNALAINTQGRILSVINANFAVYDTSGIRLFYSTFRQLAGVPSLNGRYFDPRVVFDPLAKRFIMLILHGTDPSNSEILVFVSKGEDPLLGWDFHRLPGDASGRGLWADFPNLAIGRQYLFITANLFNSSGTFVDNQVHVIPRDRLYQPTAFTATAYHTFVAVDGRKAFTLCPVQDPYNPKDEGMFFLSTRSSGSDYIDLFYFHPGQTSQTHQLESGKFTLPGDARQSGHPDWLDVGDCRVQSAFRRGQLIHFVFGTGGLNGKAEILYGKIDLTNLIVSEQRIRAEESLAYPSIVSFAVDDKDRSVLIAALHASASNNASASYFFVGDEGKIKGPVLVKSGEAGVNMLNDPTERWGDYTTLVLVPGLSYPEVWGAACYAGSDNRWQSIGYRVRGFSDSLKAVPLIDRVQLYPNPSAGDLFLKFELKAQARIKVRLYKSDGALASELYSDRLSYGTFVLSLNAAYFAQGIYFVEISANDETLIKEKWIIAE